MMSQDYYGSDNEYRMEVYYSDYNRHWVARLFAIIGCEGRGEVYLDTITDRTKHEVMASGATRIKECLNGMKHHGQIL